MLTRYVNRDVVDARTMALGHTLEAQQGVIENLASFASDNDPNVYVDAYERLANWVDNSLDMYRVRSMQLQAAGHACAACMQC